MEKVEKVKMKFDKIEQFQELVDKNLYQNNFKYFRVIFTFS